MGDVCVEFSKQFPFYLHQKVDDRWAFLFLDFWAEQETPFTDMDTSGDGVWVWSIFISLWKYLMLGIL